MERRCGDLATIADQQTLDFIKNNFVLNYHHWIGAEQSSGEWKWADGTPWSFTAWASGFPNADNGPVIIYKNYKWYNQLDDDRKMNYICQYR